MTNSPALLLALVGIGMAAIGLIFVEDYFPVIGFISSLQIMTVFGIPYRWVLTASTVLILLAAFLGFSKKK